MQEVTIGIAGAAGDGLDKSGDTLAKTCGRLGLHVYAYNSYQSIIRGGHIWLRVRIGQDKVYSHGDHLNAVIALNQDSIERHAPEIEEGGVIVFNSDKFKCDPSLVGKGVQILALPMNEITAEVVKEHGALQPIMQNTVAVGAPSAIKVRRLSTSTSVCSNAVTSTRGRWLSRSLQSGLSRRDVVLFSPATRQSLLVQRWQDANSILHIQ
jgi:Pyruvate/2-oxoacid:ferredoxin oxidoreductase gamma subunit